MLRAGQQVKITFGIHRGKVGTIEAKFARSKGDLLTVTVPGVSRELYFWPSDLEPA